jgi:hypothetical protein
MISFEPRWSAWRIPIGSIGFWHLLYLLGSMLYRQDFSGGSWLNWLNISVIALLLIMAVMHVYFDEKRQKQTVVEPRQQG